MSISRPNGEGKHDRIVIPCGKCMACLSKKRQEWSYRLNQELKSASTAFFVTLTYSEDFINSKKSLVKKDIQDFLKRLRSNISRNEKVSKIESNGPNFRYFICGEYGPQTGRPHYHGIFFNIPVEIDAEEAILNAWKKGQIFVGTVTDASISYTAKYCISELVGRDLNGNEKGFLMMSTKPGIGFNYVDKMKNWHRSNNVFYSPGDDGKKVSMPRYYRKKIFSDIELVTNKVKVRHIEDRKESDFFKKLVERGENPFDYELASKQQIERNVKSNLKNNKL